MDIIGAGIDVCWNYVHDIQVVNPIAWQYSNGAWAPAVKAGRWGDGLKLGLAGTDGTAPTTWLGSDGTNGGLSNKPESNNRCYGNKIARLSGGGITSNGSSGMFYAYNEIVDTQLACLIVGGKAGNHFLLNNYARLASNVGASFVAAVDIDTGVRVWEFNNIWNAGPNAVARSAFDANYRFGATGGRVARKNVFVNGRRQLFNSSVYDGTNDVNGGAAQAVNYVEGAGFPSGDVLQASADAECLRTARTAGMMRDINKRRITLPNNLGPYTVP